MTEQGFTQANPTATFEWTHTEGPSASIIEAFAEVDEAHPWELEPLYTAVDPEALDSLFSPTQNTYDRIDGSVQFTYTGYVVVMHANGCGHIYEPDRLDRSIDQAIHPVPLQS